MKKSIVLAILALSVITVQSEAASRELLESKLQAIRSLEKQARKSVNPTDTIVFPQVANGADQGLTVVTSIILTNVTGAPTSVDLSFTDPFGGTMFLELFDSTDGSSLGFHSMFNFQIEGFETRFLETDGFGSLISGWAAARTPTPEALGGVAAFQLIDNSTNQIVTIVGVGASDATPSFSLPVYKDSAIDSNTALALANNSDSTIYLEIFLVSSDGSVVSSGTRSVGPRERVSLYVDELFSIGSRFHGTLHVFRVDSQGDSLMAFDVHPVALFLSKGILSSIPTTNLIPY